jgi:hypothetical protein
VEQLFAQFAPYLIGGIGLLVAAVFALLHFKKSAQASAARETIAASETRAKEEIAARDPQKAQLESSQKQADQSAAAGAQKAAGALSSMKDINKELEGLDKPPGSPVVKLLAGIGLLAALWTPGASAQECTPPPALANLLGELAARAPTDELLDRAGKAIVLLQRSVTLACDAVEGSQQEAEGYLSSRGSYQRQLDVCRQDVASWERHVSEVDRVLPAASGPLAWAGCVAGIGCGVPITGDHDGREVEIFAGLTCGLKLGAAK